MTGCLNPLNIEYTTMSNIHLQTIFNGGHDSPRVPAFWFYFVPFSHLIAIILMSPGPT